MTKMKRKQAESDSEQEESVLKKQKTVKDADEKLEVMKFDARKFRQSLKLNDFAEDVKRFLKVSEKSTTAVKAFVKNGGKPLEIIEAIKHNEDRSLEQIGGLYQVLRLILFEVIKSKENIESTVQSLQFLVNRNKLSIDKMLVASDPSFRILMLKILSISVSLDSSLSKDILKNVEIFAGNENYSSLADEKSSSVPYEESIRLAFVHFMLGFLLEDQNTTLRKRILQKRNLFEFFMEDLQFDSFEIIKIILTSLTKQVLISPSFNKPEKLKIFTDKVIKSILKLYDWKGPRKTNLYAFNEEDQKSVVNITHQFLLLLLTSKKHGIVFKALSEKRQNLRQMQVIVWFKFMWQQEYPSELVIEIIRACPELMQNVLIRLVFGLVPNLKSDWFLCVNFTKRLLMNLKPELMMQQLIMLEPKKISSNIIKLSISQYTLKNLDSRALIQTKNLAMRENVVHLLLIQLDVCCGFLKELKNSTTLKHFEKHRIKFDVINHIFTFFPSIDLILNSLYRSIYQMHQSNNEEDKVTVKNQLKHTLEILLLMIKNFPSVIEKIPSVIDYLEILRPIYEYNLEEDGEGNLDNNDNLEIEMKVVKIILHLEPTILDVSSEFFKKIFQALVQVYCFSPNSIYQTEAKTLLNAVLINTGIFENQHTIEVDLWIEAFNYIEKRHIKEASDLFVKTLKAVKKDDVDVKSSALSTWTGEMDFESIFAKIDKTDQDIIEDLQEVFVMSPIFSKLLNQSTNKINKNVTYVEVVLLMLYQLVPDGSLVALMEDEKAGDLNTKIVGYIKKQEDSGKKILALAKYIEPVKDFVCCKLNELIIKQEMVPLEDFPITNEKQLLILLTQIIFYADKLIKKNQMKDEKDIEVLLYYFSTFYSKLLEHSAEEPTDLEQIEGIVIKSDISSNVLNKINELKIMPNPERIIKHLFKDRTGLLEHFSLVTITGATKIIEKFADILSTHNSFSLWTSSYRLKIVEDLLELLKQTSKSSKSKDVPKVEDIISILKKFNLDHSNCLKVLKEVLKVENTNNKLVGELLVFILDRLIQLKEQPLGKEQIQNLEALYMKFLLTNNDKINLEAFEQKFHEYLLCFCHNIGDLSGKLFEIVFTPTPGDEDILKSKAASKSFQKLLCFIFERDASLDKIFLANILSLNKIHKDSKELFFPLLNVAFKKNIFKSKESQEKLKTIFSEYKNGILKTIEKPNKAAQIYRENADCSVQLIDFCLPSNECKDLCLKSYKFEQTELYQLKVFHKIFEKAMKEKDPKVFSTFINVWLQLFNIMINKKSLVCMERVGILEKWLQQDAKMDWQLINQTHWENFYKTCLKYGLKVQDEDQSSLLMLLGNIVEQMYEDDSKAEEAAQIFDMIFTHSKFFEVIFNFRSKSDAKFHVFYLLHALVKKNHSIANEKQLQIYLSAYQGTLSKADKMILSLIQYLELHCNVDMHKLRPFLFGPTALAQYSDQEFTKSKNTVDEVTNLTHKLLSTFDKNLVLSTVSNFPIWRKMNEPVKNSKAKTMIEFEKEFNASSDETLLATIYDPAFYLPLFDMIFSTSTYDFTTTAIKNNLLSLVWPALSSVDQDVRLLAAHVLLKFRESSENRKMTKEIWIRLYDSVQHGISEIASSDLAVFPRPASITTQFLAEIGNILPNTLHKLYHVVSNSLVAKNGFTFSTVPEFFFLFHSSDVQHIEHRLFLMNFLLSGINDDQDFKLMNNTPLLKMFLSCYNCPLSDRKIDLLILKILNRLVVKTTKIEFLSQKFGLVLWLHQIVTAVEAFEYETIDMILQLIGNISIALERQLEGKQNKQKLILQGKLLELLLIILPKFTKTKLTPTTFAKFLNTIVRINDYKRIDQEHVQLVLELSKMFVESHGNNLQYLSGNISALRFLEGDVEYVEQLKKDGLDASCVDIMINSRKFLEKFYGTRKLKK